MKYYLAINRNEVFIHAKTWIDIENIMLNERNQTEKPYTVLLYSMDMSKIDKSIEIERKLLFSRARVRVN